ncbi:molybdenum cofactor guanylyltransferase [Gimesia aquarii]|uniref:Probable molybdenum cofactor guanylyltransferase n=1 Tax=Gimesia aquarii TaxID=2527964 RepID=A0A517VUB5_9PLAN|nr:molybdenum cofactor guanylyltransferase [Gimesia aquarii]QDT96594.1 molybdopterin-guanine dinucleotide biosynthesis protein A [Gimesia aquarii]
MSNISKETKIGGMILCGGESSRMDYPKAWLPMGNELMLQRVVRVVSDTVSPVIVVASQKQKLPELPESVTVIFDKETGAGPLPAIAHGLDTLKDRCDAAFVSGCDTPLIDVKFITKIISALGENQLVMVQEGKWYHPLAAVYRTSLIEQIYHLLNSNQRRPIDLAESAKACFLKADVLREIDPELRGLQNINTREQYFELLRETGLDNSTKIPF